MEGGLAPLGGGILGLLDFVEQHEEAVEYDLLTRGFRLREFGNERHDWRDLWVLVRRLQVEPGTALRHAVHGELWPVTDQLLANIVDALNHANWQRVGKKNAPKPKRTPRPWEKTKAQRIGADPIPISQFDDWWESKSKRR
ncbi:hypothetical protein OVA14_07230 [Agrococcus sp. SL85]|uniref:hypothetical protein n=1 Tax=Agrococcus sp. SL85 TaxID=2995141 RepID=UPI00226CFFAF|nr:hypothetical protein [Agrococcus sp. SL85]WAC65185.1 hypothetical protein OVA14_07230 [Agrococcus sp. SL85]